MHIRTLSYICYLYNQSWISIFQWQVHIIFMPLHNMIISTYYIHYNMTFILLSLPNKYIFLSLSSRIQAKADKEARKLAKQLQEEELRVLFNEGLLLILTYFGPLLTLLCFAFHLSSLISHSHTLVSLFRPLPPSSLSCFLLRINAAT